MIALLGEDLHPPSPDISHGLGMPSLRTHSRDSQKHLALFPNAIEELGRREVRNIMCNLELPPCPNGRGVHRPLWDALSAEVGEGLDELGILEKDQTLDWISADALSSGRIRYRAACTAVSNGDFNLYSRKITIDRDGILLTLGKSVSGNTVRRHASYLAPRECVLLISEERLSKKSGLSLLEISISAL